MDSDGGNPSDPDQEPAKAAPPPAATAAFNGANAAFRDGRWAEALAGRVWDAATGAEIAILRGHEGYVVSAAFAAARELPRIARTKRERYI